MDSQKAARNADKVQSPLPTNLLAFTVESQDGPRGRLCKADLHIKEDDVLRHQRA